MKNKFKKIWKYMKLFNWIDSYKDSLNLCYPDTFLITHLVWFSLPTPQIAIAKLYLTLASVL